MYVKTQSVSEYIHTSDILYNIRIIEYAYCPRDAVVDCSKLQLKVGFVYNNI